ncbi:hypothetical protein [Sphingobium sp. YR768]|uniref:hypothetical protein n=1 Tax=Sphingobium sp. YR768 TaxID=1884365 RepID=UPI0008B3B371|nr:hypothetical protein [Sphingobium sp. YR768]SEQ82404.1 hypothetical protein SAMN05518866_1033 [Sphingobium sp. YR768]
MLAVSKAHDQVFLYEPAIGLSVPVVLDLTTTKVRIAVPKVADLNENFFAIEDLSELGQIVPGHGAFLDAGINFSRFYSKRFRTEIGSGATTVASLRKLVNQHYSKVKSRKAGKAKKIAASEADDPLAAMEAAMVLG